ncbi:MULTISPECIES: Fur family transcriptional regulator [unclassified Paenibacillus]|uniref:Fur family transcriptional regulator n=1 Tax=unclassified Paenibacillus TaxID=185978 RepID=UPI0008391069|nr:MULTISPECIES: Fur family transcriptional regulator [unclassified Paenibacillus]NWL89096.1 transcriptional repressor [Paenibacillus sp. 79R4]
MENKSNPMIQAMESNGLRITSQRRWIAELFSVSTGFVLPRQVHAYISERLPGVSYDTVYRNLRLLTEINLLEQFDFPEGVRFKLRCGPDHHHHHFICMKCQRTFPIDFCPLDSGIVLPESFRVISHKFEIFGLCNSCTASKGGSKNG